MLVGANGIGIAFYPFDRPPRHRPLPLQALIAIPSAAYRLSLLAALVFLRKEKLAVVAVALILLHKAVLPRRRAK